MPSVNSEKLEIIVFVAPHFNIAATTSFIDPFRVANYLIGRNRFSWTFVSERGGAVEASNGMSIDTQPLNAVVDQRPWLVLVSSSWTPERHASTPLRTALQRWDQSNAIIGGLDTGGIILAQAGLLNGKAATVHYEHIDAFIEIADKTTVSENIFVVDGRIFTCSGGTASTDIALKLLHAVEGESIANASARYVFHDIVRGEDHSQNPKVVEPLGYVTSRLVRSAIDLMEKNLESTLSIPEIAEQLNTSQRQLSRLFQRFVQKSPVAYYRDIRLDRARGLVTQTELKLSEIAAASGFNSQVHFSRVYQERFGLAPSADRVAGRVPFEFRAWPMYRPDIKSAGSEPPAGSQ